MRIAVAGGTGTIGHHVVTKARERGHETTVLARSTGVDLRTGSGLDAALDGVDAVIDATSLGTLEDAAAIQFFEATTGNLVNAATRAGTAHVLALSIVGIDENPHGYYAGKVAQERVLAGSAIPWTILRATQFHEFAEQVAGQARKAGVQLAPRARIQPVAAADLAAHIVEVAESGPCGRAREVAGPQEEELADMIRAWTRHIGRRGPVLPVSLPSAQMRGMRKGLALPGPDALRIGPAFAPWLAVQPQR